MIPKPRVKYKLSCYDYKAEGIYLGCSRRPKRANKHFILVNVFPEKDLKKNPKKNYFPLIGAAEFEILEGNKLEVLFAGGSKYSPKINKNEKKYLRDLGNKVWAKSSD